MKHKDHHEKKRMEIRGDLSYAILRMLAERKKEMEKEDNLSFSGC